MSDTTNIIAKIKQAYYNAGSTSNAVSDAVEAMNDVLVNIQLPATQKGDDGNAQTSVNNQVAFTLPVDCVLQSAYLSSINAIDNAEADTIFLNVSVNAVSVIAFDSDDSDGIGANAVSALTVNSIPQLDAGEVVLVAYAHQTAANNFLDGVLTMNFRRK